MKNCLHFKKEWYLYKDYGKVPPIIGEDLWESANERLKKRKIVKKQNQYPLSGKIICANDGNIFHRRKQCKSSDEISWFCSNYLKNGKSNCNSPNVRESEIFFIIKKNI